jgi:hypothetical protein
VHGNKSTRLISNACVHKKMIASYVESEACRSKLIILPMIPWVFYATVVEWIYKGGNATICAVFVSETLCSKFI